MGETAVALLRGKLTAEDVVFTPMTESHAEEVLRIFQECIDGGNCSFAASAGSWPDFITSRRAEHCFVAALKAEPDRIVGWYSLKSFSTKAFYHGVCEVSVYIQPSLQGRGLGHVLLAHLIQRSEQHQIWTLTALIFTDNAASIVLHEKHGFRRVGVHQKLGRMTFGPYQGWRDVLIMERRSALMVD
eukprot:m.92130 g.92130  ORF g.92130 m.92130 type:complete len:187 (+) comp18266_c0_seq1:1164-1724(+)